MNHWIFRCQDVSQKVSQSMDTSLPYRHRLAIRLHLWMCRHCSRFRRQLVMLGTMSRLIDDEPPTTAITPSLSAEAKERIKRALHALP